jgi:DnaK suppressor protein
MARVHKADDGGATPSRALPGPVKKATSRASAAIAALGPTADGPKAKPPTAPVGAKHAAAAKAPVGAAAVAKAAPPKPTADRAGATRAATTPDRPAKVAAKTLTKAAADAPPKAPARIAAAKATPPSAGPASRGSGASKAAAKTPAKTAPRGAATAKAGEPRAAADTATKGASKARPPVAPGSESKAAARTGSEGPADDTGKVTTKAVVKTASPAPAKVAARKEIPRRTGPLDKFLLEQRQLLFEERATHLRQAESLKEEADALAAEMEPGESEFGEEGGEGGNLSIERELDLVLSAQAKASVEEIDRALVKIEIGTYGMCEKCGKEIPRARLKALPHAPLCVACKSGGLSRR